MVQEGRGCFEDEVFYEEVFVCIVMDIHKGGELIARMQKHWKDVGRIPVAKARHVSWPAIRTTLTTLN
eukprot:2447987-Amphidinium_carterae.1